MRWRFCGEECCERWQQMRHDGDIVEWLKCGAGERAKVLTESCHESDSTATETRRRFAALCDVSRVALSMRPGP